MEQINEEWKDIEGYEGIYEVSSLGRVRSFKWGKEKILKPKTDRGYLRVGLHKGGKLKHFLIHRLVAQAFIPSQEGLPQINHRDEDKKNNMVDNLEWCDGKYNNNYGTRNERAGKNMVQTKIRKGLYDPEMCGIGDRKKYQREWARKYRLRKKKNNRPSEESLW